MRLNRIFLAPALAGLLSLTLYSCKTKKLAAKPAPDPVVEQKVTAVEKAPEKAPVQEEEKPAPVQKPDYNFSNVQFEFNSDVLKTSSFQILDKAAREIKKDPSVKFSLNGHSSAEGTVEHNMSLSVDRANAVKSYLVNAGIDGSQFTVTGFGATKPLTSNNTEAGRALNRRVELTVNP